MKSLSINEMECLNGGRFEGSSACSGKIFMNLVGIAGVAFAVAGITAVTGGLSLIAWGASFSIAEIGYLDSVIGVIETCFYA